VDCAGRGYRTVGQFKFGQRSHGIASIVVAQDVLTVKHAVLWSRWSRPVLATRLDSIVRIVRPARTPVLWRFSGLRAVDVVIEDGREMKLGVRDPARLEAELSVRRQQQTRPASSVVDV
jgi:hypothetical protein